MTSKSSHNKKQVVKKPKVLAENAKLRKKPEYKSFRLHRSVKHPGPPLPGTIELVKKSFRLLLANKKNIAYFFVCYGLLYILLVRGFGGSIQVDQVRSDLTEANGGEVSSVSVNTAVIGQLFSGIGSSISGSQSVYQFILLVVGVLSLIWLFRQQQAGNFVTYKDALYRGMYPLVQFVLLCYYIVLQSIPALLGNYLYIAVLGSGIAVGIVEKTIWTLFYIVTLLLSFYWVSSTLIALFVVTLPEMTPKIALIKAKELVEFRRFPVFRKTVGLLIVSVLFFILVLFPLLFISAALAQIAFVILSILVVPFVVAYMFVLYRELL